MGWFEWPPLKQGRYGHSCAVLGDKIVFSGGFSDDGYYLKTTGILDFINGGEEKLGGDMSVERIYFGMIGLEDKIVAFGGEYGSDYWDSVCMCVSVCVHVSVCVCVCLCMC